MSELVDRASSWVRVVHPAPDVALQTLHWIDVLEPAASDALRIAALVHDIGDGVELAGGWLREAGAAPDLIAEVERLVLAREVGGEPEADVLRAAVALAFLDTMVPALLSWSAAGRTEDALARVRRAVDSIDPALEAARAEAEVRAGAVASRIRAAPEPASVLSSLALVRQGVVFRLARDRFPGMPLRPGHPQFQVLSYRTPQGLRAAGDQPWGPCNAVGLGYMSELVLCTQHTGAHIDAHAHMTVGPEYRWHGGRAGSDLGDFGPLRNDASEIPPIWRRGVLYDVPAFRGLDALPAGSPITAEELEAIEEADGVAVGDGDVALIRSGYLSVWPDAERLAAHRGAGPDISAARLLASRGVVAVGSDTETFEVQPAPDLGDPANPQPVHTLLLIEKGIYIMESLDLEALAAARVREFLFVALPLAIKGATGSMIDPVAVV